MTGKGIGYVSDQTIESVHHIVNERMSNSNYKLKDIDHPFQGI